MSTVHFVVQASVVAYYNRSHDGALSIAKWLVPGAGPVYRFNGTSYLRFRPRWLGLRFLEPSYSSHLPLPRAGAELSWAARAVAQVPAGQSR